MLELENLRAKTSKHFRRDDGLMQGAFSPGAVHYQSANGGAWWPKRPAFKAGPGANEWVSDESDVTMRTYQVGSGGSRRWWVAFVETLTGRGIEFELAVQPSVTAGSNALSFSDGGGGTWTYSHTPEGGKLLGPPVAAPGVGSGSLVVRYRLVGGAPALSTNPDGSVSCGDAFALRAPFLQGADGRAYGSGAWTLDGQASTVAFSYSDAGLPATAFPYRVDPSTEFAVSVAGNTASFGRFSASYATASGGGGSTDSSTAYMSSARSLAADANFYIYNGFVRWDTSSLPDAAGVLSATLRSRRDGAQAYGNVDARGFVAEFYPTWPGGLPTATHWTNTPGTDAVSGVGLGTWPDTTSDVDVALTGLTGISLTGFTALRTGITGAQPSGVNEVSLVPFSVSAANSPRLIVVYDPVAGAPAALTDLAATVSTYADQ